MGLSGTALAAVLAACVAATLAHPTLVYKQSTSAGAFIGEGINGIAAALLQDSEHAGNVAFSPLGHSVILAALAEGASGRTRSQLLAALQLPQDSSLTRATYRSVLGRMKEKNALSKPEFRSWFYVYKKSTKVEEPYTTLLREQYLMEVRDIEEKEADTPTEFFSNKEEEKEKPEVKPEVMSEAKPEVKPELKPEVKPEAMPEVKPEVMPEVMPEAMPEAMPQAMPEVKPEAMPEVVPDAMPEVKPEMKPEAMPVTMPEMKPEAMSEMKPEAPVMSPPAALALPAAEPEAMKPAMDESVKKPQEELAAAPAPEAMVLDAVPAADLAAAPAAPADEAKKEDEQMKPMIEEAKKDELMPIKQENPLPLPVVAAADEKSPVVAEPMADAAAPAAAIVAPVAEETMAPAKVEDIPKAEETKPLNVEDMDKDMAEKISLAKFSKQDGEIKDEKKPIGNKKKDDKKKVRSESEGFNGRQPSSGPSLLTTFNALYYKGEWQVPFDAKFRDDFFIGEGQKTEVTTLRTQGTFRIGDIKELNATAVELPYKSEAGRYSLLVLLPRAQDGLPKLTEALAKFSFRHLGKMMREKQVDVAIPAFEIDCISHPQGVFRKMGMTSMLEKDGADFPGISKNQRLYLQDNAMAQLVRFKLDDEKAIANYLSTMSMSTRSGLNVFHANHPFIFYLRDNVDNLTIVVGRVSDPSKRPQFSALEPESSYEEEARL